MKSKRKKFWSGNNRFRLMPTLALEVMLPAAALIYVNFHHSASGRRLRHSDQPKGFLMRQIKITGASGGIGSAISKHLADLGAKMFLTSFLLCCLAPLLAFAAATLQTAQGDSTPEAPAPRITILETYPNGSFLEILFIHKNDVYFTNYFEKTIHDIAVLPGGSVLAATHADKILQIRLDGSVRDWLVSGCDGCPALGIVSLQHGRLDLLVTTTGKMLEGGKGPSHLLRITGQVD